MSTFTMNKLFDINLNEPDDRNKKTIHFVKNVKLSTFSINNGLTHTYR